MDDGATYREEQRMTAITKTTRVFGSFPLLPPVEILVVSNDVRFMALILNRDSSSLSMYVIIIIIIYMN